MYGSRAMKIKQGCSIGDLPGAGSGKDTAPGALPGPGLDAWPQTPSHGTLVPLCGPERPFHGSRFSPPRCFPLPCAASHRPTEARACPSPLNEPGGLGTAVLARRPLSSSPPGSPGLPPPEIHSPPYLRIVGATQLSHSLSKSPAPLGSRARLILAFLVGA